MDLAPGSNNKFLSVFIGQRGEGPHYGKPTNKMEKKVGAWLEAAARETQCEAALPGKVIHVKRAWARQLRNAEVLESLEDQERN